MRIGIVCHASIGGSGLVATQLGVALAKRGYQIHFISRTRPFKLLGHYENVYFHSVDAIDYPLFDDQLYTFALTAKIIEVFEKYDLDLVHAHYSIPHSLCSYLAAEISGRFFPTITTIHGTDVTLVGRGKPLYPLNCFSINKSAAITTVSNFQREYTYAQFPIDKNINVIHNFIDLTVFSPKNASLEQRLKLAHPNEKIIMHISNFRPVKNTSAVLVAFKKLLVQVDARLVLLGDGPEIHQAKQQCKSLGITSNVTFLGKVTHVEHYIANADCVIQPSYRESFSMVALEAMASGVPIVASHVDGIPEVIVQGHTGYMTAPDDTNEMASKLTQICLNERLSQQLGANGRARAAKLFNVNQVVDQYVDCYQRVMEQHINQLKVSNS